MKVKVFTTAGNAPAIEMELHAWLKDNQSIEIKHINQNYTYATDGQFHTLTTIWYMEG